MTLAAATGEELEAERQAVVCSSFDTSPTWCRYQRGEGCPLIHPVRRCAGTAPEPKEGRQ